MADFIPKSEGDLTIWLTNFKLKLTAQGASLGISPAEITDAENAITDTIAKINDVESGKANVKNLVAQKDDVKQSTLNMLRAISGRIKTHPGYTDATGQSLGIIGTPDAPDLQGMKPVLTAETFPGFVRIKFTKKGFTGVHISTRLKGTPGWAFLARDTNSPYEDHRPLATAGVPETREYMAVGLEGDDEAGQQSDIVSVTFGG